jgi:hypothetical protein
MCQAEYAYQQPCRCNLSICEKCNKPLYNEFALLQGKHIIPCGFPGGHVTLENDRIIQTEERG